MHHLSQHQISYGKTTNMVTDLTILSNDWSVDSTRGYHSKYILGKKNIPSFALHVSREMLHPLLRYVTPPEASNIFTVDL